MEKFKNPVLLCDYSDPDAIRVGDEFFMVASSFNYVPGLPVLRSKDLVHYEVISYVCKELFQRFDKVIPGDGIWAPSIRYHDGFFYVVIPMYDEGIYVSKSKSAYGPWSKPHLLNSTKGLIDPCPFWDKDGKTYIACGFAKSKIGFNSKLAFFEVDDKLTKTLSDYTIIYDGRMTQPVIEGPKVYYINDYYFILAPAGSVKTGWQLALRSKNIYGPYEEKIILMQGDSKVNGPHQGALIDINDDKYVFMHFQDLDNYGRVCHIQDVNFIEGWPICGIDTGNFVGIPSLTYPYFLKKDDTLKINYTDFFKDKINESWQWPCNIKDNFYRIEDGLLLNCIKKENENYLYLERNRMMQKLALANFKVKTTLDKRFLKETSKTGLCLMGFNYAYLEVSPKYISLKKGTKDTLDEIIEEVILESNEVTLLLDFTYPNQYRLGYIKDGFEEYFNYTFQATRDRWTGSKFGLYALSDDGNGYAKYLNFIVENKDVE